jgi:hypothetical protein
MPCSSKWPLSLFHILLCGAVLLLFTCLNWKHLVLLLDT